MICKYINCKLHEIFFMRYLLSFSLFLVLSSCSNNYSPTVVSARKDASDIRNAFDIQDGEVRIYQRTKNSGDVWQFRMYISDEMVRFET